MFANKTYYQIKKNGQGKIFFFENNKAGLKGYVVIYDARQKPALGGIRMFPYASKRTALKDGLNLAEAMAYKLMFWGIPRGGGKAIIIGDPHKDKTNSLLKKFGEFVEFLNGEIYVGEDIGITTKDLQIINRRTRFCAKRKKTNAPIVAVGVFGGMKTCLKKVFGNESVYKKKIAIQGIGKVGYAIARLVHENGGDLIVADLNAALTKSAKKNFGAEIVSPDEIHKVECDIFSPCATGGIINNKTIPQLKCEIIAGAANNQLAKINDAYALQKRGILYAPDYVINSGAVMTYFKKDKNWIQKTIYRRLAELIEEARIESKPPAVLADRIVKNKMKKDFLNVRFSF